MERPRFTSKQSLNRKSVTCSPRSQGLSPRAMVSTLWTRLRCDDNRLACRRTQTHTKKISVFTLQTICKLFSKWINYKCLVCTSLFYQTQRPINMLHFLSLSLQIPQSAVPGSDSVVSMPLQFPWATKAKLIQEKHSHLRALIGLAAPSLDAAVLWQETTWADSLSLWSI